METNVGSQTAKPITSGSADEKQNPNHTLRSLGAQIRVNFEKQAAEKPGKVSDKKNLTSGKKIKLNDALSSHFKQLKEIK